ncbi:MAG: J domain-containing protein [Treponema sp.]|nr:J domain-containing protein [Treponema sp.]
MEDCYKLLGVKPDATIAEIRRAYREKVKKYHPDVSGDQNTAEHFKKIVRAYEILTDQKSRSIFDSSFAEHFRRRKVKEWDYREWLLSRDDDESRAKLIFFDLMRGREDDAVNEFKRMQTERSKFSLKHWFTRENFMDYGFILCEELHLRGEYYDAFCLLEQIIKMEYSYDYFRLFFPEVLGFAKNILRNHIEGTISDELALDVFERALELQLGDAEDAFVLRKMGIIYNRIGDERTAQICFEEADRISGAKK